MKRYFLSLITMLFLFAVLPLNGQNMKDMLDAVADNSYQAMKIRGTWQYSGVAVSFSEDNSLLALVSEYAIKQVESKIDEYLNKAGLTAASYTFTFNDDGSFITKAAKLSLQGTYIYAPEEAKLQLNYDAVEGFSGLSLDATANVGVSALEMLFSAKELLEYVKLITSSSGQLSENPTLAFITAVVNEYDGLQIGLKLSRLSN